METQTQKITVETTVNAPVAKVWEYFTEPAHVMQWSFASDDWHAPFAENDLRTGGKFTTTMAAKDGSFSFDFGGTYSEVVPESHYAYAMEDGRTVQVTFTDHGSSTTVTEVFDAEQMNPIEMQREGWQAILENFKKHVEAN